MIVIPAVPVVGPLTAIALWRVLVGLHSRGRLDAGRGITAGLGVGYAGAVLAVTMFPMRLELDSSTGWAYRLNLIPILTIDAPTFNLNVVMFVPLGLLLPLLLPIRSWGGALRWAALLSLSIESSQFVTDLLLGANRTADVNDVLANSMGGLVGYAGYLVAAGVPGVDAVLRRCTIHRDPARSGELTQA